MVLLHILILWALVAVALGVAFLVERRRRRKDSDEKPEYRVAQGFVASSYGLLLGLLVAFGANHHSDVRARAQDEADSMVALWTTVNVYPPSVRDRRSTRSTATCVAIRDYDWPSMERGNPLETVRARASSVIAAFRRSASFPRRADRKRRHTGGPRGSYRSRSSRASSCCSSRNRGFPRCFGS